MFIWSYISYSLTKHNDQMTMDTYGTMQGTRMQEVGLNNEDTFYSQYHSFLSTGEDYVVEAKQKKKGIRKDG